MRTLKLDKPRITGRGCFGSYIRLDKTKGVKVYGYKTKEGTRSYTTKKDTDTSNVEDDFSLLQDLNAVTKLVPEAIEIVKVKIGRFWYPGLVMEHIAGKTLRQACKDKTRRYSIQERIKGRFQSETGYRHRDMHTGNIMYNDRTGEARVIDIDVNYIDYMGE